MADVGNSHGVASVTKLTHYGRPLDNALFAQCTVWGPGLWAVGPID